MVRNTINLEQRGRSLSQSIESQLKRCLALSQEADVLARDQRFEDRKTRGLFCSHLINDAQTKLIECQLVAANFTSLGDNGAVKLALSERWLANAIDDLNLVGMILDDRKDIWGKDMPSGGLWDK